MAYHAGFSTRCSHRPIFEHFLNFLLPNSPGSSLSFFFFFPLVTPHKPLLARFVRLTIPIDEGQ